MWGAMMWICILPVLKVFKPFEELTFTERDFVLRFVWPSRSISSRLRTGRSFTVSRFTSRRLNWVVGLMAGSAKPNYAMWRRCQTISWLRFEGFAVMATLKAEEAPHGRLWFYIKFNWVFSIACSTNCGIKWLNFKYDSIRQRGFVGKDRPSFFNVSWMDIHTIILIFFFSI